MIDESVDHTNDVTRNGLQITSFLWSINVQLWENVVELLNMLHSQAIMDFSKTQFRT